jgi:hypothetical protein
MDGIIIKIGEKNLKIKKSYRGLMLFEKVTGKGIFKMNESATDVITLFYCLVKANNKDFDMNLDDFIDFMDDNEESIEVFMNYLKSLNEDGEKTEDEKKNL